MGYSKNYIMYWGVFTVIIIPSLPEEVCTNVKKVIRLFYTFFTVFESVIRKNTNKIAQMRNRFQSLFAHRTISILNYYVKPIVNAYCICPSHCTVVLISVHQIKKTATNAVFKEKVFLLWGIAKTIYNVLGGFYGYYSTTFLERSVHKLHKSLYGFLCILYISCTA